jgi:aquaporin Z
MGTGRAYVAEFIGTFALIFMGAGAICMDAVTDGEVGLVGIALAHGLAIALSVSALGHISGGHFNPAVTIGLAVAGKHPGRQVVPYLVVQLAGAVLAALLLWAVVPGRAAAQVKLGTPLVNPELSVVHATLVELVLTFFLLVGVFGTAVDPRGPRLGGFGIGLVITMDILAGGPLTGAAMNPARTFGPALAYNVWSGHLVYWIGPILGAIGAALVYKSCFLEEKA